MTMTLKSLAIAGLLGTISAPAFAAAHIDMATMTCAQYKALSAEDQMKVATMAVAEVNDGENGDSLEGTATATESNIGDTTAAEATDGDTSSGAKADGDEDNTTETSQMTEALEQLNVICDQNLDALVSEAAAGMDGTR